MSLEQDASSAYNHNIRVTAPLLTAFTPLQNACENSFADSNSSRPSYGSARKRVSIRSADSDDSEPVDGNIQLLCNEVADRLRQMLVCESDRDN